MAQQPAGHYLRLKERHGDFIDAVEALGRAVRGAGPLDEKTGHLIQLAAATAIRSEGSVRSHAARARAAGASPEEIRHAVIVLTGTIGFPTVAAALAWIDDALGQQS